ncbi:DNA-protecting protein DprA [Paracoccus sp. S-4012]|uniref:DNA-processing protein DprA n=1 Tax=Paracoccus sp. S-4012 TaxID=2665648 RepID=UPI0012B14EA0|nr:DNA-protecting protein DprA [Paracoccus sp. S-4012]
MFSFGTPTPTTTREDDLAVLRLIRSRRVGATTFHRLIAEEGSAEAALEALPRIAASAGVEGYAPCPIGVAEAELSAGRRAGWRLLRWDGPGYPATLLDLPDAPPVLWLRGNPACLARDAVAVIGARNASSLGLRMAHGMAAALSEAGVTVAAGLARGIDTAAHEGSRARGTVAVLAGGLDRIYPSENGALAEAICETGALISEQAPGTEPVARLFPLRNRIVSGLTRGVVVVEAAHRSGTLITARCALDQGREVLAVPGHPMDARAAGCNALIRDGATLVRSAADVLAALGIEPAPAATLIEAPGAQDRIATTLAGRSPPRHGGLPRAPEIPRPPPRLRDAGGPVNLEGRILSLLGRSPTDETMLLRDLGLTAAALAPALVALELDGRITRAAGGRIALT